MWLLVLVARRQNALTKTLILVIWLGCLIGWVLSIQEVRANHPISLPQHLPHRYIVPGKLENYPQKAYQYVHHAQVIPGYPCYRSVEELYATLVQTIPVNFPHITTLVDYGDSWEKVDPGGDQGNDLYALEITNKTIPGPKPVLVIDGGLHPAELTPPELAMAFIGFLTTNYNYDPDITWLVDYHKIVVIPVLNPDGHRRIEAGEYGDPRRYKNTHNSGCADYSNRGTNLNLNFDFKWGESGSSADPCSWQYRGTAPLSEPESLSYATYARSLIPDQWDYSDTIPAPITTTGVLVNMHSADPSILYPWAWTAANAPNDASLKAMAQKYASFNGYQVKRSYSGGLISGLVRDWGYADRGIPSFTLELGTAEFENCGNLPGIINDNLLALLYLARISRAPYLLIHGPDVLTPTLTPSSTVTAPTAQLNATINDTLNGGQAIAAAVGYLDIPPWITTTTSISYPLAAVDGAFDEIVEEVQTELDIHDLSSGRHILYLQGQDAAGNWGPVWSTWLIISRARIKGHVVDYETSTPINGADLTLINPPWIYITQTNSLGDFSIDALSGTYTITAATPNYYPTTVEDVMASGDLTVTLYISLTRRIEIYLPAILKNH